MGNFGDIIRPQRVKNTPSKVIKNIALTLMIERGNYVLPQKQGNNVLPLISNCCHNYLKLKEESLPNIGLSMYPRTENVTQFGEVQRG